MKVGLTQRIAVIGILGGGAILTQPAIAADSQLENGLLDTAILETAVSEMIAFEDAALERQASEMTTLETVTSETRDIAAVNNEMAVHGLERNRSLSAVTLADLLPQENLSTRRIALLSAKAVDAVNADISDAARTSPLLSQNTPASELSEPEEIIKPLLEPAQVLPESATPVPDLSIPTNTTKVSISDIQVVGSTVFSAQDLEPVVLPYEGRDLGLRELSQVADDVTRLYLENGYITSRAVLSEQSIVDGVVQIRVVEGSLEDIQIEGTRRLANYVRDRINLANKTPLNQSDLESQLQLLRADPLVDRIEASLRAGTGEGQSLLICSGVSVALVFGTRCF